MAFPSSHSNILVCILLLDDYIRFITLYHSFFHVLQGRSISISPCNNLDREYLVLFWFLRVLWVLVFLCSQCFMTTLIGALGPCSLILFLFLSAQQYLNFMFLQWKSYTLDFSFQALHQIVGSYFESRPNFSIWKRFTASLIFTCCHFFRMQGSVGGAKLNPSCLFFRCKDYYIPESFIT